MHGQLATRPRRALDSDTRNNITAATRINSDHHGAINARHDVTSDVTARGRCILVITLRHTRHYSLPPTRQSDRLSTGGATIRAAGTLSPTLQSWRGRGGGKHIVPYILYACNKQYTLHVSRQVLPVIYPTISVKAPKARKKR